MRWSQRHFWLELSPAPYSLGLAVRTLHAGRKRSRGSSGGWTQAANKAQVAVQSLGDAGVPCRGNYLGRGHGRRAHLTAALSPRNGVHAQKTQLEIIPHELYTAHQCEPYYASSLPPVAVDMKDV